MKVLFSWVALVVLLAPPSFAQQRAPEIPFDSVPDFLQLPPGMNFGEVPGVAVNSKGHIFVFTRNRGAATGVPAGGPVFGATAAQLLEFGRSREPPHPGVRHGWQISASVQH